MKSPAIMYRLKNIFVLMLSVSFLAACSGEIDDLNNYIADVKAREAEPIPPIPPVKTYTPYPYEGQMGRDPFRASTSEGSDEVASSSTSGPKPDASRVKEYLERFELDTLSMVGTLSLNESDWCLVQDPDGEVHRVAVNDYIGRNHGRVTQIRETQMNLSELITDGLGGWLVRDASIAVGEG
jgi:type IV pilus assembly protein PilP